jgi:hypothetical protein
MLADIGIDIDRLTRIKQWLLPVDPSAYQAITGKLHRRHGEARSGVSEPVR